ncbi:MAG: cytoplasmic protein [Xanthomonadaceae bacterium]|nr:cytoplasmic protein [Xanthomonadaceae bacterium]
MSHHDPVLKGAHDRSTAHRAELLDSMVCGCFYCVSEFEPARIHEWVDEDAEGIGQTALCPRCGVDSVIGSASGYPITPDFLGRMRAYWFSGA